MSSGEKDLEGTLMAPTLPPPPNIAQNLHPPTTIVRPPPPSPNVCLHPSRRPPHPPLPPTKVQRQQPLPPSTGDCESQPLLPRVAGQGQHSPVQQHLTTGIGDRDKLPMTPAVVARGHSTTLAIDGQESPSSNESTAPASDVPEQDAFDGPAQMGQSEIHPLGEGTMAPTLPPPPNIGQSLHPPTTIVRPRPPSPNFCLDPSCWPPRPPPPPTKVQRQQPLPPSTGDWESQPLLPHVAGQGQHSDGRKQQHLTIGIGDRDKLPMMPAIVSRAHSTTLTIDSQEIPSSNESTTPAFDGLQQHAVDGQAQMRQSEIHPVGEGTAQFHVVESIKKLVDLEKRAATVKSEIKDIEKRADSITSTFGNHIAYLVLVTGGGTLFQGMDLTCESAIILVVIILLLYGLGLFFLFAIAKMKKDRLAPFIVDLNKVKGKLAADGQGLLDVVDAISDSAVNSSLASFGFIDRAQAIVDLDGISFKNYIAHLMWFTFLSGVVYPLCFCAMAFFKYCNKDACNCKPVPKPSHSLLRMCLELDRPSYE